MKFTVITALSALIGASSAHMIMHTPPQWKVPGESQGPLEENGSDYPCGNGFPDEVPVATYTPGGSGQLITMGSAVHGGGSGQMVITYDFPPTKNSVWRVMQTWEGDHPVKHPGNFPADVYLLQKPLPFHIPEGLPAGRAAVAWNWFNRIGNREMYMKCATVQINGVQSSSSNLNQHPAMLALPTMFRGNSGNGCDVREGIEAIAFKNPGNHVVAVPGLTRVAVDCDDSQPGSGESPADPEDPETPYPSSVVSEPTATPTSDVSEPTADPTSDIPEPTADPTSDVSYPTAIPTGSYDGGDNESGDGDDEEVVEQPSKTPVATAPIATPTKIADIPDDSDSGVCPEGKFYCNSDNTWSRCGSGYLQNMGPVPAGMKCEDGIFKVKAKRHVRFSREHMRRRHAL